MNYSTTQSKSRYGAVDDMQARVTLLIATTITGYEVCNTQDEKLGVDV